MAARKITSAQLAAGVRDLDTLAGEEYREDLACVLDDAEERRRLLRVVRLVALAFKEPFVRPVQQSAPTPETRAWRTWELLPQASFYESADTWQYEVLRSLIDEPAIKREILSEAASPYAVARLAHEELGVVGLLARVSRPRLCKSGDARRRLEDAVVKVRGRGLKKKALQGPAAVEAANALMAAGGVFRKFDERALAAFVALLGLMGLSLFCEWATCGERTAAYESRT